MKEGDGISRGRSSLTSFIEEALAPAREPLVADEEEDEDDDDDGEGDGAGEATVEATTEEDDDDEDKGANDASCALLEATMGLREAEEEEEAGDIAAALIGAAAAAEGEAEALEARVTDEEGTFAGVSEAAAELLGTGESSPAVRSATALACAPRRALPVRPCT